MLPEIMECTLCKSSFKLDLEERKLGQFNCTICGHTNTFHLANNNAFKTKKTINENEVLICSNCEEQIPEDAETCLNCNSVFAEKIDSVPKDKYYNFSFSGSAAEYFKIWIINLVLTIFTFGIYSAWAKVRTRKYFYNNTWLDEQHFDYKANPKGIFIGYLILGVIISSYYLTSFFNPIISFIIIIIGAAVFPFLVYKSYRFMAHNSAYRNLRFSFNGTTGDSYLAYLLIPLGIPFTLGLIIPFWEYFRKSYSNDNFGFGTLQSKFKGSPKPFYKYYLIIGGVLFVYFIVFIFTIGIITAASGANMMEAGSFSFIIMYIFILAFYQLGLMIFRQYLYARLTNYSLSVTNFGDVRFDSKLSFFELFKIQLINLFAIIVSLGLLIPWAKVRRTKYILENISIITSLDLNTIEASNEEEENALGNVTTEYFELNIGL